MDLTAELLFEAFGNTRSPIVEAELIRPPFRRWFTALGWKASHLWNADRGLNRYWYYPASLARMTDRYDIYHVVDHSYAHLVHKLPAERTVVTCHDTDLFQCLYRKQPRATSFLLRSIATHVFAGMCKAAAIVCDSRQTRGQLIDLGIVKTERLVVIPIGVHPAFSSVPDSMADQRIATILGLPDIERPEILHVGSTISRKRIPFLLRFFAELTRDSANVRLIRVGGPFTSEQARLAGELGLANRIVTMPFLNRAELAAVYRRASITVLPSASEGFGLPITEALSCGTPVIASDLPALREAGGGEVMFCPVDDSRAWVRAVSNILHETFEKRRARSMSAIAWVSRFRSKNYASQTAELYSKVLGRNHLSVEPRARIGTGA
jgi:glycosyltransferase involved in cell wall biosynthesis